MRKAQRVRARRTSRKSGGAGAVLGLGVFLGVLGLVALTSRASAKPAVAPPPPPPVLPPVVPPSFPLPVPPIPSIPQMPPLPSPVPTVTNLLLVPVTDPTLVTFAQNSFAEAMSQPTDSAKLGLTPADYTAADVDGNPSNPRFMHALALFQTWFNSKLPQAALNMLPAGFPTQLRTDGVLDGATGWALTNA